MIAAADILRALRPQSSVSTPIGLGVVMISAGGRVTVLVGQTVAVFDRWQVKTPADIAAESDDEVVS